MSKYDDVYNRSINDPEGFWGEAAEALHWYEKWDKVLDRSNPPFYKWFQGGKCNTCYNAVDRHVENGRSELVAIIHDSPVTNTITKLTYGELRDQVAHFAGMLVAQGVGKGDRVVIYMPMIPQALIAMLGCARLGAVHSVVFGGFAANELAVRIDDAEPKAIVSASCGIEGKKVITYKPLLDEAIELAKHKPDCCVIFQREMVTAAMTPGRDLDWNEAMASAEPHDCVPMDATDPLYILYTSGTTGQPKGVVRDNGGHMVAMHWTMKNIYNMAPGEVFWTASDIGWVVGHSYIVYAPLLHGNTTLVYEGKPVGTPDAGAFWRVISQHNVRTLFTAPTAFRVIKKEDTQGKFMEDYDLSSLRALFLAGERADPDTLKWAEEKLGIPVIDHWWQTETAWGICANCLGIEHLPVVHGSPTRPSPGYKVNVLDAEQQPVEPGNIGALLVKDPLPPGTFATLWNADDRFIKSYFTNYPGYYETGDAGYIDDNGYVYVMARTDDVINVAGHRLSTGGMEEVLVSHPDVAESAVIGVADKLKGQVPVGFLVLNSGTDREDADIITEVVRMVREKIGPVAAFKSCTVVMRLPKTRSGKILRGTMQKIAEDKEYKMPATIDDPAILEEITTALENLGYGHQD
uniref:Propionyl-CoA synthetase n=1 Tax=Candidatus Kentrum sp. SD TaxID=2126332 RepID=A0A450YHD5_9GAMM|nr:MAG: propionyl-CoA synthetase [Candidatus Kentron sp. SD]VFK49206.1 MAG: propionyl-CoA synthetase [Candidatus Kentron sp. SD]VFK80000.1 MAG: propionyl-CoA synthetase [Candidatus Kentron sp. SD]